jgi:hypothetical protein
MSDKNNEKNTQANPTTWAGSAHYLVNLLGKYQIPLLTIVILAAGSWGIWLFLSETFNKLTDVQAQFSEQVSKFQNSQIEAAKNILTIQGQVVEKTTDVLKLIDGEVNKRRIAVAKQAESEKKLSNQEAHVLELQNNLSNRTKDLQQNVSKLNQVTKELITTIDENLKLQNKTTNLQADLDKERTQILLLAKNIVQALGDERYKNSATKLVYNQATRFIQVDTEVGKKWFSSFSKNGFGSQDHLSIIGISTPSLNEIAISGICDCFWFSYNTNRSNDLHYFVIKSDGKENIAVDLTVTNKKVTSIIKLSNIMLVNAFSSDNFLLSKKWLIWTDESIDTVESNEIELLSESNKNIEYVLAGLEGSVIENTITEITPHTHGKIFQNISLGEYIKLHPNTFNANADQYGFSRIVTVKNNADKFSITNMSKFDLFKILQDKPKIVIREFLLALGMLDWNKAKIYLTDNNIRKNIGLLTVGVHEPDFKLDSIRTDMLKDNKVNKIVYTFKYGLKRQYANQGRTDLTIILDQKTNGWLINEIFNYSIK